MFRMMPDHREEIVNGMLVKRNTIPDYFNPEVMDHIRDWNMWKHGFGLPYSGGTREQPATIIETMFMLEQIYLKYENDQRKLKSG